jgi:hypothetical protein
LKDDTVLDVHKNHTSDATNVQIHTENGSETQKWRLKLAEKGVYKVIHESSAKPLNVEGDASSDETNLQISFQNNGES